MTTADTMTGLHADLDFQFQRLNVLAYGASEDYYCVNAALDDGEDYDIADLTEPQLQAVIKWLERFTDEGDWVNWWALVGSNCGNGPGCGYCLALDDPQVIAANKAHPPITVTL